MKVILRKTLKIITFTALMFIYGCEINEDYLKENKYQQEIKISNIEFKDLLKRNDFNTALSIIKPEKRTNLFDRTIMEEEYGFTIADAPAKVIETANTTTFTLLIIRNNSNDNEFENLVIALDSLNQTQAVLVKYKPFVPIQQIALNHLIFKGNIELTPITYNANLTEARTRYECLTIVTSRCTGRPYDCGGQICGYNYSHSCGFNSDYTPPNDGSGGGGSTTTGPGVDLMTTINHQDLHASKLGAITNNNLVYSKMADLKNRVHDNKEHGYEFTTHTNGTFIPSDLLIGQQTGVPFPAVQINTKLRIHVHHTQLEAIPSGADVLGFAFLYYNKVNMGATDALEVTSIIMSNNINYALRVTNPAKLQSFFNDYNDLSLINASGKTFGDAVDYLFKNISKQANDKCNGDCTDAEYDALLEMYFMEALKDLNCGISLYYALPTDSNYSWEIIK
ncbi:hypothetical protein [Flavobacterium sp. '19STA2R22 D10 B1']|uniref:hypothetical protein n=1 Tax=Flavobacterium aerium TaxID=3037261 RepID=UPI00278C5519|nr:hypothetical protein [Flavobacterium sp. '19STA2R22 D10 B1']